MIDEIYTLLQHSVFGYAQNPQFEQAVEMRLLNRKDQLAKIEKLGGLIFDSYAEADDAVDAVNYPHGVRRPIPNARGTFANMKVDGLKLYLPAKGDPTGVVLDVE